MRVGKDIFRLARSQTKNVHLTYPFSGSFHQKERVNQEGGRHGTREIINPYNKEVKDLPRSQVTRLPYRGPVSKPVFGFRHHVVY